MQLGVRKPVRTLQRADLSGQVSCHLVHLAFLLDCYAPGTLPAGEGEPGLGSLSPGWVTVSKDEEIGI